MKKRVLLVLCMIMLLIMSTALVVACDNKDKTPPNDDGGIIDDGGNNGDNGGNKGDNDGNKEDNGGNNGDNGDNSGNLPSDGLVDISQYLTYELNEEGNSYAVTGLTEEGYKLARDVDLVNPSGMSKIQGKYKLSIPANYNGKNVTSIKGVDEETLEEKPSAFYGCTLLAEVHLPNTITSIGLGAFAFCISLTSITIPDNVTSIEVSAFAYCISLTSITIPDSVTSIGYEAFVFCMSLTSITIPESVTSIGAYAFGGCGCLIEVYNKSSLNIVAGSEGNGFIGYYAKNIYTQEGGSKLSTDKDGYLIYTDGADKILVKYTGNDTVLTLPNGITEIYQLAFYGCSSLTSITIPSSVTSIDDGAFTGCISLTSITIPSSVTSIEDGAFTGCSSLTSISIPSSVTSIGVSAFTGCINLTSITIPSSVTSIKDGAFYGCSSLIEVYNKSSLNIVAGSEDNGCIGYYAKNIYTQEGGSKLSSDANGYVIYTDGTDKILVKYTGNDTNLTLPNDITEVYQYAFYNCSSLTSITIPNSVTSIGDKAFYNCSSLTNIYYQDTIDQWNDINKGSEWDSETGEYALHCTDGYIEWAILAYELNYNGDGYIVTGLRDSKISELTIPYTYNDMVVTSIGDHAFSGCSSLTSISIPDSVTSIGEYAFYDCSGLTDINYHGTINQWNDIVYKYSGWDNETGEYTLHCTDGDIKFTIITYMLNYNDDGYIVTGLRSSKISELTIPSTYNNLPVTSIGDYAFSGCSSLITITIPNSVMSIGAGAFSDCSSLTSITIPNNVTSIKDSAFSQCSSLTSITIPTSVTSIRSDAFYNCSSLNDINYQGTIAQWNDINKDSGWDSATGEYTIHCTDGEIEWTILTYVLNGNGDGYIVTRLRDSQISELTIPSTYNDMPVTSIGSNAFSGCSSLTSITIPNSVTSIGWNTFYNCSSLNDINYQGTIAQWNDINKDSGWDSETGEYTIHCTDGDIEWMILTYVLNDNSDGYIVTGLRDSQISELTIPSTYNDMPVTSIGSYAFSGCNSLTSITIPNSVTSIGDCAFFNCSSLTSITIPNSVTSIGWNTFYNCSSLTDIYYQGTIAQWNDIVYKYSGWDNETGEYTLHCTDGDIGWTILTYVLNGNSDGYIVTGLRDSQISELTIPSTYNDLPVTSIGSYAFSSCSNLTSITIPNNVTSIEAGAFSYCSSLTSITIPNSMTSIGDSAFSDCSSLTSITIPNSVTSIEDRAFSGCSSLTTITIPNSVMSIGDGTFHACSSLTTITIPNSVTSIGASAFSDCSSLTSVTIPNSVTSIGWDAFYNCSSLTDINYQGTIAQWDDIYKGSRWDNDTGEYILHCTDGDIKWTILAYKLNDNGDGYIVTRLRNSQISELTIPSAYNDKPVTSIGSNAFYNCSNLTSITILNSVTSIGSNAFDGCSNLTSITIPNSVTSIGDGAFFNCSSLTSITIPNNVTSIGGNAFYNCSSLTSITIPNSMTSIEGNAFYCCSSLTSITIPNSVTSIGDWAFYGCSSLKSITIPNTMTIIGNMAFSECSSLTDIYYQGTIAQWNDINKCSGWENETGEYITHCTDGDIEWAILAYKLNDNGDGYIVTGLRDSQISELTIPSTYNDLPVTSIGISAFSYCSNLTSITIPNNVTSIGSNAFDGCSNLTSITIPNSVTSIGDGAFFNCSSLTSITIPNNVTSIGGNAFFNCSSLTSITIPNSVTSIGNWAFYGCSSLTSITIPNNVTSIGESTFYNCSSLTSITIPNSVTSIGWDAFSECSSLTDINYQGTIVQWNDINKDSGWNNETGEYTIHCTDGDIVKE